MEEFAVVLDQYQPPPTEKLSALFQAVLGLPRLDATTKAAKATGILAEKLDGDQARRLQFALGNLKYPAQSVPQAAVPESVKGRRVQWVLANADQLSVRWTFTGPIDFHAWSDVLVISAAVVRHEEKEQVIKTTTDYSLAGQLMASTRGRYPTTTEIGHRDVSRDMAMATITLGSGPQHLQTFRMRATELEYASMLDPAIARPTALENFCLVLAQIGNQATSAYVTEETVQLIAAANSTPRLPKSPRFDSEDQFDHYQRWLVTRRLQGTA